MGGLRGEPICLPEAIPWQDAYQLNNDTYMHLANAFIQNNLQQVHLSEEGETTTYRWWNSTDGHRTKCQALTIARLTHSLYATKIARIRDDTMLSTMQSLGELRISES